MSYISRNVFGPVIACDPYVIDGDFPAYVKRVSKEELFAAPTWCHCTCR